ncbi:MAG: hypothetical protein ANIMEMIM_00239 [Candidatus Argoarchaeum ethanivorans]|uniref:Uncharacterized protein n=1 Tax=Candidatus Argoarchaeum ethanivorans TaxID=2608793 RepID=A0A811T6F5_9EURY|nr:MAG: hypothetical protein ANIMEMIM_00239 [Candidatus Argoarchaeum ethanivorans]
MGTGSYVLSSRTSGRASAPKKIEIWSLSLVDFTLFER